MIKIEDTHQEEENPQETMATSMEDPMAQRILKALDEHGEALKRMGGRLTRLEESKLKKPPCCEILKYSQVYEPYQSIVGQERGRTHMDLNERRKIKSNLNQINPNLV